MTELLLNPLTGFAILVCLFAYVHFRLLRFERQTKDACGSYHDRISALEDDPHAQ